MSELLAYFQVGFRHIVSANALDHILFLLVLAAVYHARDWRDALWVVSAFTAGHSVTLALAVTGAVRLPTRLIEFLIPVTIVLTCAENLAVTDRTRAPWGGRYRPVFAAVFGLVHGAGFANYLHDLFVDRVAVPLLGFNVGIEAGQIVVLLAAAAVFAAMDAVFRAAPVPRISASPLRARVVMVSGMVAVVATVWAAQRKPW
ncbi:HupE/UreJ family protein [Longimicrobium sp.]|uniref:HupE/UreJ family protein n=1 Tax=Longimicrobium sp. TaxID=2029185 RepID=UPI002C4834EC|nr:HupE/UreJ family protein [Longimicrobium sp.]HSU16920.1 HupE/UreJ family protein [Longimicrobium sp.]